MNPDSQTTNETEKKNISPMSKERWAEIYQNPLAMTMGQFVTIMQLAKERIAELENVTM